ncbi:hypothetical protein HPT25_21505 [Bacillus sp. BRMEA1]|uniref:hypothetical protein n=1 Tax=Neobacillus endophyticus TaxID=2738405 RepID=UPI0015632CE7|nr:hypothetical protein [Neobacillus endophyticus]NRD79915.1 hypothetical protein [Neobacillus endophyticus]
MAFVVVVGIGSYYLFNKSAFMDSQRLDNQISQLIKQKDANQIKKIAIGDDTYNFLMNLPKNLKPQKTTDCQASDGKTEYFVTTLGGKRMEVWLKQYSKYGGLIREVELYQISIQ